MNIGMVAIMKVTRDKHQIVVKTPVIGLDVLLVESLLLHVAWPGYTCLAACPSVLSDVEHSMGGGVIQLLVLAGLTNFEK